MTVSLAFDVVISLLLVATIAFAAVLNRKLSALRAAKDDMARLAESFAEATGKAGRGLGDLREVAESIGTDLQRRIDQARGSSDDLAFLIDKASGAADRLERGVGDARKTPAAAGSQAKDPIAGETANDAGKAAAEKTLPPERRALFKALRAMR